MKKYIVMVGLCIIWSNAWAHEFRLWEDVDGNQYRAKYLRELFEKVTLEDEAGKQHVIALTKLSDQDKKYIRVMVPPKMEISFTQTIRDKEERREFFPSNQIEKQIRSKVTIKKTTRRPFTSRLYAEIFLFAKEVDRGDHILLQKVDESFLFTEANHYEAALKTPMVETRNYEEFNYVQRRGEDYAGYMVVVTDAQKNILTVKTDMSDWIKNPEVIDNLRELAVRGAPSIRSRHFDRSGNKIEVSRPRPVASKSK